MTENAAPWLAEQMTPRQRQIFATCAANLVAQSGRSMADWIALTKTCPHAAERDRLAWLEANCGLRGMRAQVVLSAAFPPGAEAARDLAASLWKDPDQKAVAEALIAAGSLSDDVITAQRKGYTSLSRKVQFMAVRPVRGGVRLGLALDPSASERLAPRPGSEPLQERLKAVVTVTTLDDVLRDLIRQAWATG